MVALFCDLFLTHCTGYMLAPSPAGMGVIVVRSLVQLGVRSNPIGVARTEFKLL